jgi:hypothetical protein
VTNGLLPRELAAAVGIRQGHVWTWAPGTAAEQDVEIVGFGTQGGEPMIETRNIIRGGYDHHETIWNDLAHFVAMATFTSDDREAYDKGADT